jgi:hypothetical protein
LFSAFAKVAPELAGSLKGVWLGGTQMTPDMYRSFTEILAGGTIGRTYGNTFGSAVGLPVSPDGRILSYIPHYPHVTMAVTDRDYEITPEFADH